MAAAITTGCFMNSLQDTDGYPFLNEPVLVYKIGTVIPQPVYSDKELTQLIANLYTDNKGNLKFYTEIGEVGLVVRGQITDVPVPPIVPTKKATKTEPGTIVIGGDLDGTPEAPTVPGLATKYQKPAGGIPKSDLDIAVRASLNSADTALQEAPVTSVNGMFGAVIIEPGAVPDADGDSKGVIMLANHLGGTAAAPTVPGLATKANLVETVTTAPVSGTYAIKNVTESTLHRLTLTGNTTFTFPTTPAGKSFTVALVQDATGGRTVTWPSSVKWAGGAAPTLSTAASKVDVLSFTSFDGTTWYGFPAAIDIR